MKHGIYLLFILLFSSFPLFANEIDTFFPASQSADTQICSDETFIRRTYLTLTGRLPLSEKVVSFLEDNDTGKRDKLIEEILDSDAYIRYMQMRWGDILRVKSEFPSNLWPNGVQAYNRWIYSHLADNTPYNLMVRDLLLSVGSNFKAPAVNFYRAFLNRTPEVIYENINLLFLGQRSCKDEGFRCFEQLSYKSTKEWKEEIVYLDIHKIPGNRKVTLQDGSSLRLENDKDWRISYVDWLTSKENGQFAAVIANRLWFWIMGKGIVDEPDDWGTHNPPSNKALLDFLTKSFVDNNFDMKALTRLILQSGQYQNKTAPEGSYKPQRLPAEVIVDALADLTGMSDVYRSRVPEPFTIYPEDTRAVDLGDATVSSPVLELFGKVSRDISLESQRNNKVTSRQLLYLMNSSEQEEKIRKSKKLTALCRQHKNIPQLCHAITLMTLARRATPKEIKLFTSYARKNQYSPRELATDIMWVQINSNEFLFNH